MSAFGIVCEYCRNNEAFPGGACLGGIYSATGLGNAFVPHPENKSTKASRKKKHSHQRIRDRA